MKHRKLKTCLLLLLIPVLLLALYIILDLPFLSTEAEYRLAEKAAMVGPGKILGITTLRSDAYNIPSTEMVIARTEHAAILYYGSSISYRKDLGEDAILVFGAYRSVVLFDKYPEAVRAELELEIDQTFFTTENKQPIIRAEAQREREGYFLFDSDGLRSIESTHWDFSFPNPIPAHVRLYGKDGVLIANISAEILSPGIIAHRERGEYKPNYGSLG